MNNHPGFLLIFGSHSYPSRGEKDWFGTYKTEEAASEVGNNMLNVTERALYDWYEIVDLSKWILYE